MPKPRRPSAAGRRGQTLASLPVALLVLASSDAPPLRAQMPESPAFVEVTGTGQISVKPDQSVVTFAVETEAPTAEAAAQENARLMERVLEAVRRTRLAALQVGTHGYQLQPVYRAAEEPGQVPRIGGYRALNFVRAQASDVTGVGRLIDAAIGAGANRVAGLEFQVADPEPLRLQALEMAVARARGQAETMARALGVPLGPVLEVHGGAESGGPFRPYLAREMMVADTPIEAGDQQITATVTVRFALQTHPDP
ncbi:MAG: SIMPL domain-containing protein [Gemmatimonadota bacterium]